MASNVYTQDIVLDADGKPVFDALANVQQTLAQIQRTVAGIGLTTEKDAKEWGLALAQNLKLLKQAESDLRTLQTNPRTQDSKSASAKIFYKEEQQRVRETGNVEKQIAKEVADYEREQDRKAISSAKEVAAARREAAQAAVTAKARGITNRDDASAAKAASDARLNQLRRERDAVAGNDVAASRAIADRITIEKALGRELDSTINKLNRLTAAENTARAAADRRMRGVTYKDQTLLAPSTVQKTASQLGNAGALDFYKNEQATAQSILRARIADSRSSEQQRVAAQRNLETANKRVTEAQKLVTEENRIATAQERQLKNAERLANAEVKRTEQAARAAQQAERQAEYERRRSPMGRVQTAATNLALYGGVAGVGYAAFNAVQSGVGQVVEMEDELAKLQAIANATDPQLQQLKASIYDIGSTSRFSVIDLAKISQTLAQAGVSASQMQEVLKSVTTLATASGSTPDEAVNLVTSALGSFQLQASEAARVSDLMTSALNRTKLTVQQTGQAIQYVGATAYEQNISLETLLATVGAIAQAGVRSGSTIGTGFRQFLVDLQNPSEKLQTQLKALNISASDVDVSTKGLPAVLEKLRDSGFGAGQAYAGLETRAAAFYLVAKNNVDIMDQLMLSFANSGAAATANERAMNSLGAQWQRFKNILAEGLEESLDQPLTILKNILTSISDKIEESRRIAEEMRQQGASPNAAWYEKDYTPQATELLRRSINIIGSPSQIASGGTAGGGLGDWIDSWTKKADGATVASERLETAVSETTDAVDQQTGRISELDKEMARLAAQKENLRNNDIRSGGEIVTLTAKFEGLAGYLINTGNRYDDLTQAVDRYRLAQLNLLNTDLTAQGSALNLQTADARQRGGSAISQLLNNPNAMSKLTSQERAAVRALRTAAPNSEQAQQAQGLIGDAVRRFTAPATFDRGMAGSLNQILQAAGVIASNTAQSNVIQQRTADNTAAMTPAGRKITNSSNGIRTLITELGSAEGGEKARIGRNATGQVNVLDRYITGLLADKSIQGGNRRFLESAAVDLKSMRQQINATLLPTKSEETERKRREREAKAADREASRKPLVTQADIDAIGTGLGLKLGSGVRTKAEQNRLHARGLTPATGDTSSHSNGGIARDFSVAGLTDAEARRYAATMRAQYQAKGIDAFVQFETGKGRGQGSGRHIHVNTRKGTRLSKDREGQQGDRIDAQLAQDQLALDQDDLANKIKAISKATTSETFDEATKAAKGALDAVNAQVKSAALDELAAAGVGPGSPRFKVKMLQVDQEIAQNIENYQQKIAEALIKSADAQTKAAQTAFETATSGAAGVLSAAQGAASGLDNFSLRNRVPDYVRQLAGDRVNQAQEGLARAQYAALPNQIAAKEATIAEFAAKAQEQGVTTQTIAQLDAMNKELTELIQNREALGAQLGADGLLPTSVGAGLNQAIEAYRNANNLSRTFSDELIMNMGGAIDTVDQGLQQMFTGIMTGSQTALGAFASFAKGMIGYIQQMLAKMLAAKALQLILNLAGAAIGGKVAGGSLNAGAGGGGNVAVGGGLTVVPFSYGNFHGGPAGAPINRISGGEVVNGSPARDSVNTNLAKGEWVIQKEAVDSVGPQFMAKFNQHGAKALQATQSMPQLDMKMKSETNVWLAPLELQPSLGVNDVRVILSEELMSGDGKRLVQHIQREG